MTVPSALRTYTPHIRLTASGTFQNGSGGIVLERWAWRLNLSDPRLNVLGGAFSFSQLMLDDYASDISAFHGRTGTQLYSFCRLTEVKMARIGANGKYTQDPLLKTVDVPGGAAREMDRPPQVALAVSLGSNTRGPRGKGRFYLPAPAQTLGSDLLVLPEDNRQLGLSLATFFADLTNFPGLDPPGTPRPTIASSKGTNSDVTTFRVGRALDTIRSRREGLAEKWSVPTVVGT